MVHEIQNEIQSETDIIFCHFGSFLPFYPFTNLKKLQFYKVIYGNHMMYGSWDMESDRHNFCHFMPVDIIFYMYVPQMMII